MLPSQANGDRWVLWLMPKQTVDTECVAHGAPHRPQLPSLRVVSDSLWLLHEFYSNQTCSAAFLNGVSISFPNLNAIAFT